jgi:hypothetical protein
VEVWVLYHLDCNGSDRYFSGSLFQEEEMALGLLNEERVCGI